MSAEVSTLSALVHQRAMTERLLLSALRERELTTQAVEASVRANFLASASRDLSQSLDQSITRDAVRRRSLPRAGSWCIVDIVDVDGTVRRLAVAHPDPAKQVMAQTFAERWFPTPVSPAGEPDTRLVPIASEESLTALRELGFGGVLVVPLAIHDTVLGTIAFIARDGDGAFSDDERVLASEIAHLCALALDNARLYREAHALREVADEANRAKSVFLGNMSHELMTPLNAIGGYAALIEMGLRGPVTPEQQADLVRIKHNQAHLLTLIAEILTFVKNDSGRLEYRLAEVSVESAVDDVAEMLTGAVLDRHLALIREPQDPDAAMWADADRVRQILLNLVTNAVKYATTPGARITLSSSMTARTVAIHVADDGPGIPAEKLETIFDPFVQLASGLTDRRGGVGLGLAISRDLARAMDGDLTVSSHVGAGSRFTLELPRARRAPMRIS